jgi:hypothetical protein
MSPRLIAAGLVLTACTHPHAQRSLQPQRPESAPTDSPSTAASQRPAEAVPTAAAQPATRAVDFARDVRPIMESRCQPCHFTGGRMYDRLPFDEPETIRELGERLFTRIKTENEQAVIRQFLAQPR